MRQIRTWLPLILALCLTPSFAGSLGGDEYDGYGPVSPWTGFRVGLEAGYFWSANNVVQNVGLPATENALFLPGSQTMANVLGYLTSHHFSYASSGFLGGLQLGYLSQFSDKLVIGVDADINALGSTHASKYLFSDVTTTLLGAQYANGSVSKKINYLGFIKGRLGYLLTPRLMGYGLGAFAYGGTRIGTEYTITSSNPLFPPAYGEAHASGLLGGWGVGLGGEWLMQPCWSLSAEYIYYNLGPMVTYLTLDQSILTNPAVSLASAKVKTIAKFRDNAFRLGLHYRFA